MSMRKLFLEGCIMNKEKLVRNIDRIREKIAAGCYEDQADIDLELAALQVELYTGEYDG